MLVADSREKKTHREEEKKTIEMQTSSRKSIIN